MERLKFKRPPTGTGAWVGAFVIIIAVTVGVIMYLKSKDDTNKDKDKDKDKVEDEYEDEDKVEVEDEVMPETCPSDKPHRLSNDTCSTLTQQQLDLVAEQEAAQAALDAENDYCSQTHDAKTRSGWASCQNDSRCKVRGMSCNNMTSTICRSKDSPVIGMSCSSTYAPCPSDKPHRLSNDTCSALTQQQLDLVAEQEATQAALDAENDYCSQTHDAKTRSGWASCQNDSRCKVRGMSCNNMTSTICRSKDSPVIGMSCSSTYAPCPSDKPILMSDGSCSKWSCSDYTKTKNKTGCNNQPSCEWKTYNYFSIPTEVCESK